MAGDRTGKRAQKQTTKPAICDIYKSSLVLESFRTPFYTKYASSISRGCKLNGFQSLYAAFWWLDIIETVSKHSLDVKWRLKVRFVKNCLYVAPLAVSHPRCSTKKTCRTTKSNSPLRQVLTQHDNTGFVKEVMNESWAFHLNLLFLPFFTARSFQYPGQAIRRPDTSGLPARVSGQLRHSADEKHVLWG